MKNKKLLIVLGSLNRGGAERVISIISDFFCEKKWDVTIALLLTNSVEYQINEEISIVDLSGKIESRIRRLPGWILKIRNLVKKQKPDVILSFAARINVITLLSCLGLKQKIVVSERNDPYKDGRSKFVDIMTKWLYPKAKSVVFQTKRAKAYFESHELSNATIMVNPISVKCLARKPTPGKIVTVGRLAEQKNHKLLIDAFYKTLVEVPYANLFIYGDGVLKERLINQIEVLSISKHVHLMGNVSDIHEQIADAELFVLSSDYEGLSNALLEALKMGLTCITTNCAGSDEYIINQENGLIVNVGDKDGLATAMIELLQDRKQAKILGEEAYRRSRAFDKEVVLNQWYKLIDEVSMQ